MGEIIGLTAMILFIILIMFLIVAHKSNMSELEKENKELKEEVRLWKEYQKKSQDRDGEDIERLLGENIKLKERIAEYDDLTEELDYRKREAKRLGWSSKKS